MSLAQRHQLVDRDHRSLSIARQCALLGVSRSSLYYRPKGGSDNDLSLMQAMDRQYLETPFYGSRRMKAWLGRQGKYVSRKRVQRLTRIMNLRAIHRRPRTSRPAPGQPVFPYMLEKVKVSGPNQVWAANITYLPMARGFLYLVAVMDWHSRYVVAWRLSNTLEADFFVYALQTTHDNLGSLSAHEGKHNIGIWNEECLSHRNPGNYARYYRFTLEESKKNVDKIDA